MNSTCSTALLPFRDNALALPFPTRIARPLPTTPRGGGGSFRRAHCLRFICPLVLNPIFRPSHGRWRKTYRNVGRYGGRCHTYNWFPAGLIATGAAKMEPRECQVSHSVWGEARLLCSQPGRLLTHRLFLSCAEMSYGKCFSIHRMMSTTGHMREEVNRDARG